LTPDLKGKLVEHVVQLYLRLKGYKILEKRYRTKLGEIDLIVLDGSKALVAVEIKYRRLHQEAMACVSKTQMNRIHHAIKFFLSKNPKYHTYNIRFDVVAVGRFQIHHIKQAWMEG
jgi:putative endonuclease